MTIACLSYSLCLAVRSPFLFPGLIHNALVLDSSALRDGQGRPLIPSDQVRGVFKDSLRELPDGLIESKSGLSLEHLFGMESPPEEDQREQNRPKRRRIHFADLSATCACKPHTHTRIELDDQSGTVKSGAFQVVELVAPMGETVSFNGTVQVIAEEMRTESIRDLLAKALALLGSIGSAKSSGFGEVIADQSSIEVDQANSVPLPSSFASPRAAWPHGDRLSLTVTFDRPILFDSRRLADNAFASASVIPGAAFKGALADVVEHATGCSPQESDMAAALTSLHLSHAFPLDENGVRLHQPLPQSMVAIEEDASGDAVYGDAILGPPATGAMITDTAGNDKAGLAISDWKSPWQQGALRALGWAEGTPPPTQARTHAAIEPTVGAASAGNLYTTHLQEVTYRDGTSCVWQMDVDLGRLASGAHRDRGQSLVSLMIEKGLYGMGGTGATAHFSVAEQNTGPQEDIPDAGLCLRLLTPALLFHPNDVWPSDDRPPVAPMPVAPMPVAPMPVAPMPVAPMNVYGDYFSQHAAGTTLRAVFARQTVVGGYLARRRRAYGNFYFPFVVTAPGAVFLLDCPDPQGRAALADMLRWGLPPPPYRAHASADPVPMTWKNCPFMPENGFAAVTRDDLTDRRRKALLERVHHA